MFSNVVNFNQRYHNEYWLQ